MKLMHWYSITRQKAVWGPKATIAALLLATCLAPITATAGPHKRQADKKKPGVPSAYVKSYRLDDELTQRSTRGNQREITRVIVTLVPGATLPPEFKKYAKNGKLDLINGQVLELPNSALKQMSAHPPVFRIHHDRATEMHNYRTAVTVGARTVQNFLG